MKTQNSPTRWPAFLPLVLFLVASPGAGLADADVGLCHKDLTIHVNENAVAAHLAHGDTLDACSGSSDKVTVCHKEKRTLTIGESSLEDHLAHGDSLGACP